MPFLKKLFWAYFLLLIFEGALRKWVVPQLSAPLLLVRDPIGILIIWEAYRTHKWPKNWSALTGGLAIGLLALSGVQLVTGDIPWFAAAYGLRSYLLPFPIAFIMGENLDAEDLSKFGTCTLWLLLPLTALAVAQYYALGNSFLNKGTSTGAAQLDYAAGHVRASGTFSYVSGMQSYLPLAAALIFYGMAQSGFAKRWLLWLASSALFLAVPFVGSRTAVYELAAIVACMGVSALFGVTQFAKSLQIIVVLIVVFLAVSRLPSFSEASDTLFLRFSSATASEGGSTQQTFLNRIIGPAINVVEDSVSANNWLGMGVGSGAVAISTLMTGSQAFTAGEGEFERNINEFGLPAGLLFMLFRLFLAVIVAAKALSRARERQPLALLLLPLTAFTLLFGTLEQVTVQGFMVISLAFSLAAMRQERGWLKSERSTLAMQRNRELRVSAR